uniref:Pre-mRNA-splicing factor SLU7 n=1 Tax=Macrostomum lignano TaxID=282301 RepID=A0A1I8JSB6_9PLAT
RVQVRAMTMTDTWAPLGPAAAYPACRCAYCLQTQPARPTCGCPDCLRKWNCGSLGAAAAAAMEDMEDAMGMKEASKLQQEIVKAWKQKKRPNCGPRLPARCVAVRRSPTNMLSAARSIERYALTLTLAARAGWSAGAASLLGIAQWACQRERLHSGRDGSQRPVAMWLARRSLSKPTWPGHLDNLVGGGLPSDCDSPNAERPQGGPGGAGIPGAPAGPSQSAPSATSTKTNAAYSPTWSTATTLALPDTFSPVSGRWRGGGVRLVPLADLPELIAQPDFKPNSGLVCLDFLLAAVAASARIRSRFMSFLPNLPPSVLAKNADAEALGARRSKEEYRKMKELEEARKLAAVPAMKDEEGKDINPHIPQYIMQAPWYYGALHPTLKHQIKPAGEDEKRQPDTTASGEIITMASGGSEALNRWYKRGQAAGPRPPSIGRAPAPTVAPPPTRLKDCFQRPRPAAPNQHVQPDLKLDFEAKRDRWNGYDPASYRQVIDSYAKLEEARKQVRSSKQEAGGEEGEQRDDEDRYGDEMAMPGQKFDCKERQSVRNLRIREDTAKYLYNLDPSSAYYDPRPERCAGNPFEGRDVSVEEAPFAGDNYIRYQGDALPMMEQQQVFAWELQAEKGVDAHLQANPTRLELLHASWTRRAKKLAARSHSRSSRNARNASPHRYGGQEHLRAADSEAPELSALSQTEQYAEYSRTGTLLRGAEAPAVRSRYDEDKKPLNHTSVWGSYWEAGKWGYKCCRSTMRNAYCTGLKGRLPAAGPPA